MIFYDFKYWFDEQWKPCNKNHSNNNTTTGRTEKMRSFHKYINKWKMENEILMFIERKRDGKRMQLWQHGEKWSQFVIFASFWTNCGGKFSIINNNN